MSHPIIDFNTLPAELVQPINSWQEQLANYQVVLLKIAHDVGQHLDQEVGGYLDLDSESLKAYQLACANWLTNLEIRWDAVEQAWVAAHAYDGIPAEAQEIDQTHRRLYGSAKVVVEALGCFFDSVVMDSTSIEGLTREAQDEYKAATKDGHPNTAPLPNPWTATPQQMPRDALVREVMITHQGQQSYMVNLSQWDIDNFDTLLG